MKYLLNINIFKCSFVLFFALTALNSYNKQEFFIQTSYWGWLSFIIVIFIIGIYLVINLFYTVENTRLQIQITSYFFLTGLTQIIISTFQVVRNNFNFENELKMWFIFVYIGLFLFGILLNKRYDVIASIKKKKSYWKEINTKTIIFTIFMQLYITSPIYFNTKIEKAINFSLEYPPLKAINNIIKAGPSTDYLQSHDNKTQEPI